MGSVSVADVFWRRVSGVDDNGKVCDDTKNGVIKSDAEEKTKWERKNRWVRNMLYHDGCNRVKISK